MIAVDSDGRSNVQVCEGSREERELTSAAQRSTLTCAPRSLTIGFGKGPSEMGVRVNHAKSRIRARIEHVFGAQQNAPGGRIVRTIGIVRARAKISLQNLAYNIRRLVTLERLAAA